MEAVKNGAVNVGRAFAAGDAETKGRMLGRLEGEIALAFVGTKGIDKLAKAAKGIGGATRAAHAAETVGKGTGKAATKVGDFAKKPFVPDEYWQRNAPRNAAPGSKFDHYKINKDTNQLERSKVIYDNYGRQRFRVDYSNHGRTDHSVPHLHETEYGPKFDPQFGKESRYYFLGGD